MVRLVLFAKRTSTTVKFGQQTKKQNQKPRKPATAKLCVPCIAPRLFVNFQVFWVSEIQFYKTKDDNHGPAIPTTSISAKEYSNDKEKK